MIVLYDGVIVTMDNQRNIYKKSALVIEKNKIKEIGNKDDILKKYKGEDITKISCCGKVIFPGFVNSHIHTAQSIVRGVAEDLGSAPSYTSFVPQGEDLSEEESYVFSLLGAATALRFGSTIINDNYSNSMVNAKAFETIGIRAVVSERVHDMVFAKLASGVYEKDDRLGENLLNKNMDLFERYNDDNEGLITPCLGPHAPDTCSKSLLLRIADLAQKYNVPITTHLAQSKQEIKRVMEEYGVSSVELLNKCGLLNDRLLAAHGVLLNENDIQVLSESNVNIIHIPEGNAKAGVIANVKDMADKGLNVAIGTDNGAGNMIENMRMALVSGRIKEHCIIRPTPEDILTMATINGAKALHFENKIGSIEVGKLADIVIVDYDNLHMTPCTNAIGNLIHLGLGNDVETVIVNGRIVVDHGKVLNIDEKEVMRDARRIAELKWTKSNPDLNRKYIYVF